MAKNIFSEEIISENHSFSTPIKLIKTVDDMLLWDRSEAYFEYMGFIFAINESVRGKINSQGSADASENVNMIINLLDSLDKKIDEIPPIQQPQRFGNQAFKTWYNHLKNNAIELLQSIFPESLYRSIPEIMVYLIEGFGNSTRIDYGTGHELSFIMFMCCLFKIGFLKQNDQTAAGCKIFVKYLNVVRKLQKTYRMEPAGSHGVWSLDDFQFVPFIWGSNQFYGSKLDPTCFLKDDIVHDYAHEYMFLSCIKYINEVKSGPFAEHSNQLWSISGVPTWSKVNIGLIKMYKAEVLCKFPLVQHIVFGSLFSLKPVEAGSSVRRMPSSEQMALITKQAKPSFKPPPPPPVSHASPMQSNADSTAATENENE